MEINWIWEMFGYLAGICTAICFLPQTIKTLRTKDVRDLSIGSYLIYVLGMVSWTIYGIYLNSIPMIFFNGISLAFAAAILYMIIRYKGEK